MGDPTPLVGNIVYLRNVSPLPIVLSLQGGAIFWTAAGVNPNLTIPPDTTYQFLAISDSVTVPQAADASHQQGLPGPTWMQIGA